LKKHEILIKLPEIYKMIEMGFLLKRLKGTSGDACASWGFFDTGIQLSFDSQNDKMKSKKYAEKIKNK
jgi:hypothetical protein